MSVLKDCLPDNFLKFCPHCGSDNFKPQGVKEFLCDACGFDFFVNSAAAVTALILDSSGSLLVTRRGRNPGKGLLDLPGGFVDPSESLETALRRELSEELGVSVSSASYFASAPNVYVFSGYAVHTTDVAFVCSVSGNPSPADDVDEILWLSPESIDLSLFAFPSIRSFVESFLLSRVTSNKMSSPSA